jgi:hypothetical protein
MELLRLKAAYIIQLQNYNIILLLHLIEFVIYFMRITYSQGLLVALLHLVVLFSAKRVMTLSK